MDGSTSNWPVLRLAAVCGAVVVLLTWALITAPIVVYWNEPVVQASLLIPTFLSSASVLPLGLVALFGGLTLDPGNWRRSGVMVAVALCLAGALVALQASGVDLSAGTAAT